MSNAYRFEGRTFIIENYAEKPAFTNFLPGIAGVDGRPLWAFYINRGQGIAGFGVHGKDSPIMEFFPAEIAYAEAPRKGFRTFLKINGKYREPFTVNGRGRTKMEILRRGFAIEETRRGEYEFRAEYFGVPSEEYAALARVVRYTNTSRQTQTVEYLDGLAHILPYGLSNADFKETGNLLKSWMCVSGTESGYAFYKMRSSTADSAEVSEVKGGNFFVSSSSHGKPRFVVDPKIVFGEDKTATRANVFAKKSGFDALYASQNTENEFACAFANGTFTVAPNESFTLAELIGYADGPALVRRLSETLTVERVLGMQEKAEAVVSDVADRAETHTAYPLFDEYIRQSYFDNVLRGGMPVNFGKDIYYVYSRKHGDPERDYNAFVIEPQPYSCGNGNFRDVAQNRRNDVFFTPVCGDFNVRYFFSLLQLDGYNPLSVLGVRYVYKDSVPEQYKGYEAFLRGGFTVGELCTKLSLKTKEEIEEILSASEAEYRAAFGEGYWTDHFVYLIDLAEAYLAVWPERREELLFKTPLRWFQSRARVLPRSDKTVLRADGCVRRYDSVVESGEDGWKRTADGGYFETSLAAKLLHLITVKLATLDPLGCGIDMEAGKPGWNDATNGLPSVFGSNVADAVELKRLVITVAELVKGGAVEWSVEQNVFFENMLALLRARPSAAEFYEKSNDYKEAFRKTAYGNLSGERARVTETKIAEFLTLAKERLGEGLARATELGGGWYPTYLRFDVTDYEKLSKINSRGLICVKAKNFCAAALPHFAEGVAKGLPFEGKELYLKAKASRIYDETLGLYRTSEPLDGESMEIGRIRSFPKGWLERESCFLHMNYKLMLALLTAGLYDEFFQEIKTNLVPFMDPEVYGRSTLENSSFLVTSNHCDKGKWGRGFQARLTGANAEMLSMWRIMMGIERPFTVENGELKFALSPVLPKDFFDSEDRVSFRLFGKTKIIYYNQNRKDTYAKNARIIRYRLRGDRTDECTAEVKGTLAEQIRSGNIKEIEVEIE